MNAPNMKRPSKTNWARINALTDDTIDTWDVPPLTEAFFSRATLRQPPRSVAVTVHIDADVLAWFKAQDNEYERRMNAALRIYVEAHQVS